MEFNLKSNSSNTFRQILVAIVFMLAMPAMAFAQAMISGTVTDEQGEPLIGATVLVEKTKTGVSTNIDGKYTVKANKGQTLVFSYIGMTTQKVVVGINKTVNVKLTQSSAALDDVVVIGYGKQKKASITGAVSAIKGEDLLTAPATNVSQMLGGRVAGVSSVQTSGEPGQDQASLRIRGAVTGVTYIVDGVPRSINDIDPNDIESLSVLKDASATAVYGLGAAGGVIIVTTKKGKQGAPKITYDGSYGGSFNANFAKFMNGLEFMNYYNMADMMDQLANGTITDRSQYNPKYTAEMFRLVADDCPDDGYDNVNYIDEVFGTGTNTKHNLSVQGGTENSKYYASIGYLGQDGNIDGFTHKRYSMRLNLDSKIAKYWKLTMGAAGYVTDTQRPGFSSGGPDNGKYEAGFLSIAHQAIAMHPYLARKYNGNWTGITSNNGSFPNSPLGSLYESGYSKTSGLELNTNIALEFTFPWVEGLSAKWMGSYDYSNSRGKVLQKPFTVASYNKSEGTFTNAYLNPAQDELIHLAEGDNHSSLLLTNFQINYNRTFGKHNVGVLGLMEARDYKGNSLSASVKNLAFAELPELSFGEMDAISGGSDHTRALGYVFRGNYNFDEKYYVEFSGRYDGSYKFSGNNDGKRWAFFPSASVAWRLSKESFMEKADWLNDLKIRASIGLVGDDAASSAFAFLSLYDFGGSRYMNGQIVQSLYRSIIANPDLSWQKTRQSNIGFDATLWNELLGIEFDAFYNYTFDMLTYMGGDYPPSMGGYYKSIANYSKMDAKGIDILVTHKNTFNLGGKPFSYQIGANVSWAKNRWLKYPDSPNIPEWQKVTGKSVYANYGWVADGLYRSEEEIDNSAWYGSRPNVGDIKYVDLNGDGVIDSQDRGRIGQDSRPQITYGLNLAAQWNGIDINAQFTGGAKFDVSMTGTYYNGYDDNTIWTQTFKEGGNSPLFLVTNAWNIDNPNGTMPRLTTGNLTHGGDNGLASTFWFRKGNYIRLKSAQIGYTFPKKWMDKLSIDKLRVYVEGSNLFTLDNLPAGFDPESPEVNNGYYPQQRTVMGGLTLTF